MAKQGTLPTQKDGFTLSHTEELAGGGGGYVFHETVDFYLLEIPTSSVFPRSRELRVGLSRKTDLFLVFSLFSF